MPRQARIDAPGALHHIVIRGIERNEIFSDSKDNVSFLELVRYIHLNPLRAGMVKDYQALESYPFCGHGVIVGKANNDWMDVNYTLAFFAKRKSTALKKYREYVEKGIESGSRPDLVGGGVIRSAGGWSEVKKTEKEAGRLKGDERILGDSEFVLKTLVDSEEEFERKYELKALGYDLGIVSKRVAEIFEMSPEAIFTPGKYRKTVQARSLYCYWAVRELGETATSLAKKFGISQPTVSISVLRGEKIVKDIKLKLMGD